MRSNLYLAYPLLLGSIATGCAGSSSSSPSGPQLRALNTVGADPVASIQDGTTIIASSLPYATESGNTRHPYATVPVGPQTVTFTSGGTTFASLTTTLANGQFTNAIASGASAGSVILLEDDTSVPADAEIRFVNASSLGGVDFVLTPSGGSAQAPVAVAANAVFPVQPALPGFLYQVMTAGTYRLQVYPSGQESTASPYIDETVSIPTGKRWTLVLANANNGYSKAVLVQVQDNQQLSSG